MSAIKLYTFPLSGHSHRVELFLSLLGLEAELINLDLANGEHKTPEFLAKNPAGQIPVLEDGDITLADSNAILLYLANKYDAKRNWYPEDLLQQVEIQKYFSLAAGKLTFGPCNARLINVFGAALDKSFALTISHSFLTLFNQDLANKNWLVGDKPSLADIAHYTYIAHAPEGDVSLEQYPNVTTWLTRIEALKGFKPMQKTQVDSSNK
ncbi:glutathione S-transferase family protein [Catenovulum maritimum]|uniref:Glutathione S-transferase n=1 Tax=Catenovulum maritimum TaxID=1513271 RepID=A0A0J8GUL1_9ALTE|nr:glutathione S-transferase [Catenovulum maritimum]KMT64984.1 glutathione S-transferase [Catenovulum maritimum]